MTIQIDNGDFTRIHNDILDGLAKAPFTALEFRCVFFLVRMTYGWQKKEDTISLSQWAIGIGIDSNNRGNILNTLNGLVRQGVIYTRSNGNNRPATWGLNKAYFEDETVMQPHNSIEGEEVETVMPEHNTSVMQPHNSTVISEHNSFGRTVMQPHNSIEGEEVETVMPEHNTSVMQPHNSTVISEHNSFGRTVMQPHNLQRKILKKELKKVKENTATQPAAQEKTLTPQQAMYGAICEALGWDYHTITDRDKVQVAQAVKILTKADYDVEDIRRFMVEIWFRDWRWEKFQQRPTLAQLRQDIGKLRAGLPEHVPRNGAVVDKAGSAANELRSMLKAHGKEEVLRGQVRHD